MAKYILSIFFSLLLIGFVSCDEEKNTNKGQGYLYLGVEKNVTMQTKAVDPVLAVAILNAAEDTVKYIADFEKEKADEGILLDAGTYQVVVASGKKDSAAWELPNFYGKTECEIKTNQVTSAKVTCKIANTKVTVDYSDDFKKYFMDYSTTVSNSSGSLTYVKGETRGGYFAPETLSALLKLTNTDGEQFQLKREYKDIQERYHYKLFFKLSGDPDTPDDSGEAGGKFDDITVDESADTVVVSIPIKVEDLENIKAPECTLEGFGDNNSLEAKAGEFGNSSLKLIATCGIEKLLVTIESDSLLNRSGLPSSFDLANLDPATKTLLESIHFPIPENIKGAKDELSFDLTEMSNALASYDDKIQMHRFTFTVRDAKTQEQSVSFSYSVKPNVAVITKDIAAINIWSTFTLFSGESDSDDGLGLEYKKVSDSEWTLVDVTSKNADGKTFSVFRKGLEPKTAYVYRAFSSDPDGNRVYGNEVEFKTDYANADDNNNPFVPNLGFEDWSTIEKYSWSANAGETEAFWGSGNKGANTAALITGVHNPTAPEETTIISGKAVKLASDEVFNVLAAASLYTGYFKKTDGTNGILSFGRPYVGRPTQLTGFYKYISGSINIAKSDCPDGVKKDDPDQCHIYVALCTQEYEIRTKSSNRNLFKNDDTVLAYGELISKESVSGDEKNGYKKFAIDIKYKPGSENKKPTHILIVATASKYGDYFTGSTSSVLYLDEFELKYDYNPASFVGTSLEGLGE